jgi:hypothetical protein
MEIEDNKSLEDWIRDWAGNENERTQRWYTELNKNDIDNIHALERVARSSAWNDFLMLISPVLRANIEEWKRDIFDKKYRKGKCCIYFLFLICVHIDMLRNVKMIPCGAELDFRSIDTVLRYIESGMRDSSKINLVPHILSEDKMGFSLVGREDAVSTAMMYFQGIIDVNKKKVRDRTEYIIPVCSGISGLGKTRMLDEGLFILQEMGLKNALSVSIPYFNGFKPVELEAYLPIEASFSWRLLYKFFLDGNCDSSFGEWLNLALPVNGYLLNLATAFAVIHRKLSQSRAGPFHLFVGIDEYQKIEEVGARPKNPNSTCLRELVEAISDFICSNFSELIVLPMLAGTDFSVIQSGSIANSSYYLTERLPMKLLTLEEVFRSIESNPKFAHLLSYVQIRRHLFYLGGVPRWIVDYITEVVKKSRTGTVKLEVICQCYHTIVERYASNYFEPLQVEDKLKLAAYSISALTVNPSHFFSSEVKWSKLRDSSICLLVKQDDNLDKSESFYVQIPYSLFIHIADHIEAKTPIFSSEQRAFIETIKELHYKVDSLLFDLQPWQLWEKFGAYFYALRMNAFLILGKSCVSIGEFLKGALIAENIRDIEINLAPANVFFSQDSFGADTTFSISKQHNKQEKVDWIKKRCVKVNGDNGEGVDIFFAQGNAVDNSPIIFVDQRKRAYGKFHQSQTKSFLDKLSIRPESLPSALMIRGVMNCVSLDALGTDFSVPSGCYLMSRKQSKIFHGSLAYHPACSPYVSINSSCKTALKTLFLGTEKAVNQAVEKILGKRKETSYGFQNREDLQNFLVEEKEDVQLIDDDFLEFSF